jgi:polysaccharide pyruvyl transferase WcaK-like protein
MSRTRGAAGILAAADAVVSHSYHLALWALESGTPAVLVAGSPYYEQKASGLGRLAGLTGSIAVTHDVDAAALRARLERVRSELSDSVLADAAAQVQQWWDDQLGVVPVRAR